MYRAKTFTLILCLLGLLCALTLAGQDRDVPPPRSEVDKPTPKVVRELPEKRTGNARHYLLNNGNIRAEISGRPTHVLDDQGRWQPLNPRLVSGQGQWQSEGSLARFHQDPSGGLWLASPAHPGQPVGLSGLRYQDGSGSVSLNGSWTPRGPQILERTQGNHREQMTLTGDALVQEWILDRAPASGADPGVESVWTLPEGWSLEVRDPGVADDNRSHLPVLLDEKGVARMWMLPPVAREEGADPSAWSPGQGLPTTWVTGEVTVEGLGQRTYRISVTFPEAWFRAPERTYPVRLDPSLTVYGDWGGFIYFLSPDWVYGEANPYTVVYLSGDTTSASNPSAGYINFDISSLPTTARVVSATLEPFVSTITGDSFIAAYPATGYAPLSGSSQSELQNTHADLRGVDLMGLWYVTTSSTTGLQPASGNAVSAQDLQRHIPRGTWFTGWLSDGTGIGDNSYRLLDSGQSRVVVEYEPSRFRDLVISEVNQGSPDYVEIYNYGHDVDMTGMELHTWDGSSQLVYAFPSFTLKRHSHVTVYESTGTDTATTLYTGANWGWTSSGEGEVGLTLSSNYGIDYVSFGDPSGSTVSDSQSWIGDSVAVGSNYLYRSIDEDTDQARDWVNAGAGSAGLLNTGQVGSRRRSHLVINEVSTNPDSVEILNLAPVPQLMDNFTLDTYSNDTLEGSYTFPAGTEIASGGLLRLTENTGTDTLTHKYMGHNITWTTSTTGEVRLRKSNNLGQSTPGDYMAFNYPEDWNWPTGLDWHGTTIEPANSNHFRRLDHLDTDSVFDWTGGSGHNLGALSPTQVNPLLSQGDEISTSALGYTSTGYTYGNRFSISENQILVGFKQDVTLNADQVVNMLVYEDVGGGYSLISQTNLGTLSAGSQVVSSGNLNIPLVAGGTYVFALHGAGSLTYRRENESAGVPEFPHFGSFQGRSYSSSDTVPASVTHGTNTYSVHQWIETLDAGSLEPLTILTSGLPDASQSTYYSQLLFAQGGAGGYTFSLAGGSLPLGMYVGAAGELYGTPSTSGDYTFTLEVTDAFGNTAQRSLTIHVIGNNGFRFLSTYLPDGVIGQAYPDQQLQSDGGTAPYYFSFWSGSWPPGLSLTSGGAITGTPTTAGTYTFTLRGYDSGGHNQYNAFTVTVDEPFEPPYWVRKGLYGGEMEFLALSSNWSNDQTAFAVAEGARFFRTIDGGLNWETVSTGLYTGKVTWSSFSLSPTYNQLAGNGVNKTIFARVFVWDQSAGHAIRSTNGGDSWAQLSIDQVPVVSPDYANDGTVVAIHGTSGIYLSTNNGVSFSIVDAPFTFKEVMFSPGFASDQWIYAMGDDDYSGNHPLYRSNDLGQTWQLVSVNADLNRVVFSPNFATDSTLFGYGAAPCICVGLMKSTDGGFTWTEVADSAYVIQKVMLQPDYDDTDSGKQNVIVSMGFYRDDIFLYRTANGGQEWTRITTAVPDEGGDIGYWGGGEWTPMERTFNPLAMSPDWETDQTLVAGQDGFWVSENSGVSWEKRANGLNGIHFSNPNLLAETQVALAYSPNFSTDNTFFVATRDGGLYKTTNRGRTLTRLVIPHRVDPASLELDIHGIALSNTYNDLTGTDNDTVNETKTLFVAAEGGVYRSRDGGQSWTTLTLPVGPYTDAETYQIVTVKTSPNFASDKTVMAVNKWLHWRSTNAGTNFSVITTPTDNAQDLAFSPSYYWDHTAFFTTYSKVYRSSNYNSGTPTWTELLDGGVSVGGGKIQLGNGYYNGSPTARQNYFWIGDQKTLDNGATWSTVNPGVLSTNWYGDDTLLRTTSNPVTVRISTNGGGSDSLWSSDPDLVPLGYELGPFIAPGYNTSTGVVVYLFNGALLLSEDGGQSYEVLDGTQSISNDVRGVETDPNSPSIIFAATGDGGLFKSTDKGLTFHHLHKGLPTVNQEFNDIRALTSTTIIAAHAVDGVYRSTNGGINWSNIASTTGNVVTFSEGGGAVWGARSDGRSIKSTNSGSSWVEMDPAFVDMVDFSYAGDVPATNSFQSTTVSANQSFKPGQTGMVVQGGGNEVPFGLTSPTWGVSKTSGPAGSEDGGVTFTSSTGSGGPFPLPTGVDYLSVLVNSADNLQVLTGTGGMGVWKTWDGGDTWHPMTWGLESSSQVVAELYETSNGDILAGITGTTDGGVYLSADGGEHWVVINEGFDPDELSVQDLVNDPGDGSTISYWAGKDEDGIWTRTIEVLPNPNATSMSSYSSNVTGGVSRIVYGNDFQDGAVVFFDGIPAATTFVNSGQLNVTVPAHYAGTAEVVVMNPDTRADTTPLTYTYNEVVLSNRVDLSVTTDGTDVTLTWTDPLARGSYNVFWTTSLDFGNEWVEVGAEGAPGPSWTHTDAATTSFVYFYKVE